MAFASRPGAGSKLDLPYEVMDALEKSGQAPELWVFLKDWLGKYPAASEWDRFNRLSAQLGRQKELKAMIAEMAASGAFAGLDRLQVQEMQADAELATDDLAAAVARLGVAKGGVAKGSSKGVMLYHLPYAVGPACPFTKVKGKA